MKEDSEVLMSRPTFYHAVLILGSQKCFDFVQTILSVELCLDSTEVRVLRILSKVQDIKTISSSTTI